jgi:hypothetical protein
MKSKYSFVCEAANISSSGNLNAFGIFQSINIRSFPFGIPRMFYVAGIQFHRSETGRHGFSVNFIDDDGRSIVPPLEREVVMYENKYFANFLVELENTQFHKPGTYQVNLMINNQPIAANTIRVFQIPPEPV